MIALDRGKLDEAERHFRRMIDLSRKRLPRRLTPRIFKNSNHGKPYQRGLSNLLITLNRLERYEEALRLADQLEHVCGDLAGAECHRAGIHLNRGALEEAVSAARYVRKLWPEMSFIAAMGSFELGRMEESVVDFLHGACNLPGAVPLMTGRRAKAPKTRDEYRDRQAVDSFPQNLAGYMARNGTRTRRFFGQLTASAKFGVLMGEIEETRRRRDEERGTGNRIAWNQIRRMESPKFAAERAAEICRLLRPGKVARLKAHAQ